MLYLQVVRDAHVDVFAAIRFLWETFVQTLRSSRILSRQRTVPSIRLS